jgi:lactate dehydrogenase-like 2-hydroxyacid dehydrogenase
VNVLQVGRIEPSLADVLKSKYHALQLPNDPTRAAFLAEHGASVTAIIDFGPPGVDADLMKALPNLGAIVHHGAGYDTIDVAEALRNLDQYLTHGTFITPVVPTNSSVHRAGA